MEWTLIARNQDPESRPDNDARDAQATVVAFMRSAAPHRGASVEHVETHISHVFLAGPFAYKMKKAVKLDFVDFSTLARRREACEREIEVNSRTAPDIYLEVMAINEIDGALSLGPPIAPVEYLVKMRRFSQSDLFDRMATENRLTATLIRQLADAVAELHLSAAHVPADMLAEDFGTTAVQVAERLTEIECETDTRSLISEWCDDMTKALADCLPEIRGRARHGGVRHGHGDLHLRNICLFEGNVRLFDAIEFEPKFSHIDILYDIAFAVMDLLHRRRNALAILLLSRYLAATRDYSGIDNLRLFISVRAAIRAMVALLGPNEAREATARSYLELATRTLRGGSVQRLVAIGGRSGTGKSTLAKEIAPAIATAPDIVIIRSDEVRKHMLGLAPEDPAGPGAYDASTGARVYRRLFADARRALRNGASVIIDAAFLDEDDRHAVTALGEDLSVATTGIWLRASSDLLADRLLARKNDASDADTQVMLMQVEPREFGDWISVDAARPIADVTGDALRLIAGSGMQHPAAWPLKGERR